MASVADTKVSSTGEAISSASVVHGLVIEATGTAGTLEVRDGGSSATVKLDVPTAANAETVVVPLEGGGVRFGSTVHVSTLTNINNVTFIYEDIS